MSSASECLLVHLDTVRLTKDVADDFFFFFLNS